MAGALTSNWRSSSSPLSVTGYGSTGWGYGYLETVRPSTGDKAQQIAYVKINNADNHTVYANGTTALYNADNTIKSSTAWNQSTHKSNSSYVKVGPYASTSRNSASKAKGTSMVCIDVPVRYDPCSGSATSSLIGW